MLKVRNLFYAIIIGAIGMFMFGCSSGNTTVNGVGIEQNKVAQVDEGHAWTHGDWSSRVLYEARYALSASNHNGTSNNPNNTSTKIYGDWNYVANDAYAHSKASAEAHGTVGTVGQSGGYYLGGWCTYFVRLVLYRATYTSFSDHYTVPNYGYSGMYDPLIPGCGVMDPNPANWQGGWVLRSGDHYAFAEQRVCVNGSWGWWIIDSNWVKSWTIGKHFFTDNQLSSGGFYGWRPVWGSYN
jgi:hypothetical protein